jgi:hypothetical protein
MADPQPGCASAAREGFFFFLKKKLLLLLRLSVSVRLFLYFYRGIIVYILILGNLITGACSRAGAEPHYGLGGLGPPQAKGRPPKKKKKYKKKKKK